MEFVVQIPVTHEEVIAAASAREAAAFKAWLDAVEARRRAQEARLQTFREAVP